MCSPMDSNFGDIQFDKESIYKNYGPTLNDALFSTELDFDEVVQPKQEQNLLSDSTDFADSLPDLPELFNSIPMGFNFLEEAMNIDGNSCDFTDTNISDPTDHLNFSSPDIGTTASDITDAASEVSSTSDLGSMSSGDSSPERTQQELLDFSLSHSLPKNTVEPSKDYSTTNVFTAGPNKTQIKLETIHTKGQNVRSVPLKTSATTTTPSNIQSIVLNQGNKQPFLRSGTLVKTTNNKGSSVYYPCIVKNLGQGQTFKLISSPNGNTNQLKNGIRTLTVRTSPQNGGSRPIVNKSIDGRPILKVGPTLMGNHQTQKFVSSTVTVKDEPILCDADDDESPKNGQKLELTEEEKRLLKKEHITLPSCYPLTKHQERDLKRIRRKIRNKISAQDSRKRKKEYVDGLEDKVKSCSDENQKLQRRIRHLETENETLAAHLKKYQELVESGNTGRSHGQTSTALMVLILSAALVIVPNLRPKDITEGDLAKSLDEPLPGKNRNLLGSAVALVKRELNVDKLKHLNLDENDFNPLSEHDYAPLAKRPRLSSSSVTPFHDFIPKVDKTVSGKAAEPPDPSAGGESVSAFLGAMLDTFNRNWNESRQEPQLHTPLDRATQSLVVSLHNGKMRDDIELE